MAETFNWNVNLNQDTDTKDELDKVLTPETLAKLKERFPEKMDEIFVITKEELSELKILISENKQDEVAEMIRRNLIEDDVDGEEQNDKDIVSLDTIMLWTKSEQIDKVKIVIEWAIAESLKDYMEILDPSEVLNISVWITAKILDSDDLMTVFSGLWDIAKNFTWNLKSGKFKEAFKWTQSEVEKLSKIKNILEANMKDLLAVLEENKDNKANLKKLLSNPKAITEVKVDTDLTKIKEIEPKELTDYLLKINEKVLSYDEKIEKIDKISTGIINAVSNSPEYMQKMAKKTLEFLLKLPLIWDILAAILWYNWAAEALTWFWKDIDRAKATNNLISHWENKEWINTNPKSIGLLEWKDLTWLEFKKLKPFFLTCEKEWIDYTAEDFWHKLFSKTKDPENEKFNALIEQFKIEESDFENKKPKSSFYEKLNWIKIVEKKKEAKEDEEWKKKIEWNDVVINETVEELDAKIKAINDSIVNVDNFKEKENSFKKLGEKDLDKLLENISLWDLWSDDYKERIQEQIGGYFKWMDSDYADISKFIETLKDKLEKTWVKEKIEEAVGTNLNRIKFKELLESDSKVYAIIHENETEEVDNLNKKKDILGKRTKNKEKQELIKNEKDAITNSIKSIANWDFTTFEYEANGKKNKIKFDSKKKEISINTDNAINTYKIELINWFNIWNIDKEWDNITLKSSILEWTPTIDKVVSIKEFSSMIYELKTKGIIKLKDENWDDKWEIKKTA